MVCKKNSYAVLTKGLYIFSAGVSIDKVMHNGIQTFRKFVFTGSSPKIAGLGVTWVPVSPFNFSTKSRTLCGNDNKLPYMGDIKYIAESHNIVNKNKHVFSEKCWKFVSASSASVPNPVSLDNTVNIRSIYKQEKVFCVCKMENI